MRYGPLELRSRKTQEIHNLLTRGKPPPYTLHLLRGGPKSVLSFELTNPFVGLIKLSPGPVVETLRALGS